jgi:hypothetical protein
MTPLTDRQRAELDVFEVGANRMAEPVVFCCACGFDVVRLAPSMDLAELVDIVGDHRCTDPRLNGRP